MQPGISTHVFLPQRLHTGLLDAMHRAGATAIEIFAARHHFDYTDRAAIRDLSTWFRDTGTRPSLHQPLYADTQWSRHVAPNLNLIDPEKSRRILAMDETKRALESAEQIPFRAITLHLGAKDSPWDERALENSLTAIEHVKAFAGPLGVQILLENLQNDVTTPEHLLEILRVGHFDTVGICLDLGHAHLTNDKDPASGIDAAFELLKPRIAQLHLHDNHGRTDEHLWPSLPNPDREGKPRSNDVPSSTIDWRHIHRLTSTLPAETPGILEIAHDLSETPVSVQQKATASFDFQRRLADQPPTADETSIA